MITRYGFRVLSEEAQAEEWILNTFKELKEEKNTRILFVEVELNTPAYPNKAYCSFYYARNFAKTIILDENILKIRFPKSFIKTLDSGEEYSKVFKPYK